MNTNNECNFNDVLIYLPEKKQIVKIAEGTGDNLLDEDIEEGYVDYIYYSIYDPFDDFEEVDGGDMMTTELVREKYTSLTEAITDILEFHFDNRNMKYYLM